MVHYRPSDYANSTSNTTFHLSKAPPPLFGYRSTNEIIESIQRALPPAMGDRLISVIHYGRHVHDDPDEKIRFEEANFRLLIVVRDLELETLESLADAIGKMSCRDMILPIVMTQDELKSSTDVFPIMFLEMQRAHRVLLGEAVLASVEVQRVHVRLRSEQEMKNLVHRMQSAFLTNRRSRQLQSALVEAVDSFVRVMAAAVWLVDQQLPADDGELIQMASAKFGFDADIVERASRLAIPKGGIDWDTLQELYVSFMSMAHETAATLDRLPLEVVYIIDK